MKQKLPMRKLEQFLIAVLLLFTFSCSKNSENDDTIAKEEIDFVISFSDLSNSLKSGSLNDSVPTLDDAKQIVLTIKSISGENTKYTNEKIEIFKMNGTYFSQKLSLVAGDYKLTEFFLIDSLNNTIFATPLTGSQQAQNVDRPLPIDFSIAKDQITSVNLEVLATTGLSPADFGLVGFIFHEVPTFSFLINVSEKGQMDSLLTAPITITNGTYSYSQTVAAIANNVITIRDGNPEYKLSIAKEGYVPYNVTFTVDSLKQHTEFPLTIELEKIETITDIDGNVYSTIKIGNQIWMAENLKVTRYNDGTDILNLTNDSVWGASTIGAYCWYDNNLLNEDIYGALYNWYSVKTEKLAPEGWHVPTDAEWTELKTYLTNNGHSGAEGTALKTSSGWSLSGNGTDNYGFSGLPCGQRYWHDGIFYGAGNYGNYGYWWATTEYSGTSAYGRDLHYYDADMAIVVGHKSDGYSVRCIKD
jgi:uncharacterized protein (TIGR02145 family)